MLRKLVSAILIFTLATFGLSQASPAQAAGTFSPVVSLPQIGGYSTTSIPLGDTSQLKIWQNRDDNGTYLKTGILKSDGTWSNHENLVSAPTSAIISEMGQGSWVVNSEGTIAVTWTQTFYKRENNQDVFTSYSYIAYTEDGIEWSAPIEVFAPREVYDSNYRCDFFMECGYSKVQLAVDSKGTLTAFTKFFDGFRRSLLVSTSMEGIIWSAPSELESTTSGYIDSVVVTPLPAGGFMAVWVSLNQTRTLKYSTMSEKKYSFWQRPKVLGSAQNGNPATVLIQTDLTHLSLFYMTGNPAPMLHQQLYDLTSKTWGVPTSILTAPWDLLDSSLQIAMGKNWHGAIGVGLARNGVQEARSYILELNNSVPSEAKLVKTASEQAMTIAAIRVNFDDSITMMMHGLNRRANIMNFKAGVQISDEDVPTTGATQLYGFGVTVSPSGNIFISTVHNTGTSDVYEGLVYRQASAPIAVGDMKLSGVAKIGSSVIAKIPTFTGVSNIGTTSIKWYSCSTKSLVVQLTIPLTCLEIAKATAVKFKVTSKQKNKYLGVAVSNTNSVGTTTMFLTHGSKAK